MRGLRYLVPLLVALPLAAPDPADAFVEGRAHALVDPNAARWSPRTAAPPATPGDGIVDVRSRLIERDADPPAVPVADWSYGPFFSGPPVALESTGAPPPGAAAPEPIAARPDPGDPDPAEDQTPPEEPPAERPPAGDAPTEDPGENEAPVETMPGPAPDPEPSPEPQPPPGPAPVEERSTTRLCLLVCVELSTSRWT